MSAFLSSAADEMPTAEKLTIRKRSGAIRVAPTHLLAPGAQREGVAPPLLNPRLNGFAIVTPASGSPPARFGVTAGSGTRPRPTRRRSQSADFPARISDAPSPECSIQRSGTGLRTPARRQGASPPPPRRLPT